MIPSRLALRNFMCYRGEGATLDLDGVSLACLTGENGAGKSALLGAMTWALWGKARDRVSDDELICQGATEMEVDFLFILGNCRYRVVRKRSKKGTGSTILELHMQADEEASWRPLTGHSVRDTQAKINDLLKMEYDTFINSAFILQGRADEFTVKNAAERKKVLADILGLDEYDRLEELAKDEAKECKAGMQSLENRMELIDKDLLLRPDFVQRLQLVTSELEERQQEQAAVKEALNLLLSRQQDLQGKLDRLKELENRKEQRKAQMASVQTRIFQNNARKAELETLLSRRDEVTQGYMALVAAREEEQRMSANDRALKVLQHEASQIQNVIDLERMRLQGEARQHERLAAELGRNLSGRITIERNLAEALDKVRKLEKVQAEHEDARCLKENLDTRLRTLNSEMSQLEKEGKQLREKLNMILTAHGNGSGHASCPLCETALTEDALERVKRSYDGDISFKQGEYVRKRNEQRTVHEELVVTMSRQQELAEQLKALPMQQKREAEYEASLRQLDKDSERMEKEQSLHKAVQQKLDNADYSHEERAKVAAIQAQIRGIDYDPDLHSGLITRIESLKAGHYEEQFHALPGAESALEAMRESLLVDNTTLVNLSEENERDTIEIASLEPQQQALRDVQMLIRAKREDEKEIDADVERLVGDRGKLTNSIERCDNLQIEKQSLMEQYKAASEEKRIFDDLAVAFGKKGIQAMIIENIIPELEDEANSLLQRMTDGRMTVQFRTQKDAKTVKSVIETLDINISDEMGTRAYELYSGGEAFRVNFAVRIALSKLLASRAGAQLQMLVIDEGFGTQDGQGRDKLVGAIRSIQDDFQKILVVTHIEELKNEFPVRIDIIKTETGTVISTN